MIEGLRPPGVGDNLTTREYYTLGRFKHLGLMPYRDLDAFFCLQCRIIYNVRCANCGAWSNYTKHSDQYVKFLYDPVIYVEEPIITRKQQGVYWTLAICRKCDFKFLVMVR